MRKHFVLATAGAVALSVMACSDRADEANTLAEANIAASDETSMAEANSSGAGSVAAADPDWPQGTRVIQEGGTTYRVNSDGSRVRIDGDEVRIVSENGARYRVNREGTRIRIDERGVDVDLDGPDIPGVDVDLGTNRDGNIDLDISTDGKDATPNR